MVQYVEEGGSGVRLEILVGHEKELIHTFEFTVCRT